MTARSYRSVPFPCCPVHNAAMQAIVIGGTGAVGSSLVRELIASSRWEEIIFLTRRASDLFRDVPKVRAVVVDLNDLQAQTAKAARGCQAAFNTMGVGQPSRTPKEEVWKVDVEYAGAFARGCRTAGVEHISLLSSVGANASSRSFYIRVKGAAEEAVRAAGIRHTSLFRPSLLVTREIRYGLQDRLTQSIFPKVSRMLPARFHPIRVEDLGRAMRLHAERSDGADVDVLQYPEFQQLLENA
ncbi:MAG: NAD(P)H-binding protein [Thermoanaerobaculia bacterium]